MPRKKSHYAVARGRQPGIYTTWNDCKAQTDGFTGAIFKGFFSEADAQQFLAENQPSSSSSSSSRGGSPRGGGGSSYDGSSYGGPTYGGSTQTWH
eukprot:g6150.t1